MTAALTFAPDFDQSTLDGLDPDPKTDPEAPYGRKEDGTPYLRSPEWRAKAAEAMAKGRTAKARAKRPAPSKSTGGRTSAVVDYRPAVAGLLQIPAAVLAMAARFNPALALDAVAITVHTPPIAAAVHDLAMDNAQIAAVLEKVSQVGPYGALVMAVIPLVMQIAGNHGILPVNPDTGILGPEDLLKKAGVAVDDTDHS